MLPKLVELQWWTQAEWNREARMAAGAWANARVVVVPGDEPPHVAGQGFRWETRGGKPVYYPNAYRRAWGKPVYVHSTLRVVVGANWRPQRWVAWDDDLPTFGGAA